MKLKGEYPRGRPRSRWEQVRKDCILKEGRKNMKEIEEEELWKTVVDAVSWLLDNKLIV